MIKRPKLNRNQACHCGSGKKYKMCCEKRDGDRQRQEIEEFYTRSQSLDNATPDVLSLCKALEEYGPVILITDRLTKDNYKTFQVKNWNAGIIMVAEKTDSNKLVFEERDEGDNDDTLVMYKGAYRIFKAKQSTQVFNSILEMFEARNLDMVANDHKK